MRLSLAILLLVISSVTHAAPQCKSPQCQLPQYQLQFLDFGTDIRFPRGRIL